MENEYFDILWDIASQKPVIADELAMFYLKLDRLAIFHLAALPVLP